MTIAAIPGYRIGDPALPLPPAESSDLEAALLQAIL